MMFRMFIWTAIYPKMTTILGIDPGTNITGFGVIKLSKNADISYVHHGIIKTGLKNKIVGGKKILSKTISLRTVESEISIPLEKVQNKFKKLEIGSYPFFKQGKIGVSLVIRSSNSKLIESCIIDIMKFVKKKKIKTIKNYK